MDEARSGRLDALVRDVPDFPRPGVVFKDLTPLLADPDGLAATVDELSGRFADVRVDRVVGIEARGFVVAAPVAVRLGAGFVPVRKPGKLPGRVESQPYDLEYGSDVLEIQVDGVSARDRVLIVDDVLATGGTAAATAGLVERLGAAVVGLGFVLELGFLGGRTRLPGHVVESLLVYDLPGEPAVAGARRP